MDWRWESKSLRWRTEVSVLSLGTNLSHTLSGDKDTESLLKHRQCSTFKLHRDSRMKSRTKTNSQRCLGDWRCTCSTHSAAHNLPDMTPQSTLKNTDFDDKSKSSSDNAQRGTNWELQHLFNYFSVRDKKMYLNFLPNKVLERFNRNIQYLQNFCFALIQAQPSLHPRVRKEKKRKNK